MPIPEHWSSRNDKHDSSISLAAAFCLRPTTMALSRWMFSQIHNPRHIFRLHSRDMFARRRLSARVCVIERVSQFATNCQLQIIEIQFRVAVNASPARWNLNDEFAWRLMISSRHQQAARAQRSFSKSKSARDRGGVGDPPPPKALHFSHHPSSVMLSTECLWAPARMNIKRARRHCVVCSMRDHLAPPHSGSSPRENEFGMQRNEHDKNWWK